jgi:hypothetical protein
MITVLIQTTEYLSLNVLENGRCEGKKRESHKKNKQTNKTKHGVIYLKKLNEIVEF